jgi:hypothetical protein
VLGAFPKSGVSLCRGKSAAPAGFTVKVSVCLGLAAEDYRTGRIEQDCATRQCSEASSRTQESMFDPRNWTTERKARELDWGACAGKSKFKGEICPGIERVWGRCQHQSSRAHTNLCTTHALSLRTGKRQCGNGSWALGGTSTIGSWLSTRPDPRGEHAEYSGFTCCAAFRLRGGAAFWKSGTDKGSRGSAALINRQSCPRQGRRPGKIAGVGEY